VARVTLQRWLEECASDPDKDGPLSMLVLEHIQGNQGNPIHRVKCGAGKTLDTKKMAALFQGRAETHAGGIDGMQQFRMLAFFAGSNEAESFYPFKVAGPLDGGTHGLGTEPPTEVGQRMQHMRHNEALVVGLMRERALVFDRMFDMYAPMQRMVESLTQRNTALERENLEMLQTFKELSVSRSESAQAQALEVAKYNRQTKERAALLTLLAPAANQLLGREIFPQSTADTALVEAIAENVDPARLGDLVQALNLPPEKLALLVGRLQQVAEKRTKDEETALSRGSEIHDDAQEIEAAE
jgi:hypothetical protein